MRLVECDLCSYLFLVYLKAFSIFTIIHMSTNWWIMDWKGCETEGLWRWVTAWHFSGGTEIKIKYKVVSVLTQLSDTSWRHMGEWRYSSTILDLDTKWKWVVSFMLRPLYRRGKNPRYPLDRKLGVVQSRSGRCGVQKNLLPLPEIESWPST
jgi:hypothetical protein